VQADRGGIEDEKIVHKVDVRQRRARIKR
jgi:hypothetical protein